MYINFVKLALSCIQLLNKMIKVDKMIKMTRSLKNRLKNRQCQAFDKSTVETMPLYNYKYAFPNRYTNFCKAFFMFLRFVYH